MSSQDPTSGLKQLLKALPDGGAPKATYVKGDRVVVVAGDLNTPEGEELETWQLFCSSYMPRLGSDVTVFSAVSSHEADFATICSNLGMNKARTSWATA